MSPDFFDLNSEYFNQSFSSSLVNSYGIAVFYLQKLKENNTTQINALKGISPIAWVNINFHGKYDLSKISSHMSLSGLVDFIKNETLFDEIFNEQEEMLKKDDFE